LKRLGASVVIKDDGVAHRDLAVREVLASMPPVKLALNGVGGASSRALAATLASGGVMATYGGMGRKPVEIPAGKSIFEDIEHRGFWLTRWLRDEEAARRRAAGSAGGGEEAGGGGGGGGGEIAAGPRAGERAAMAGELYDAARAGALRMPAVEVGIEEVLDAMRARPSVGARKLLIRMPWEEWAS
jgi:trans-2-enoyl-CoA reductase